MKRSIRNIICLPVLLFLMLCGFMPVFALENKTVQVETRAGSYEDVTVETETETTEDATITTGKTRLFVTGSGMIVDYDSEEKEYQDGSRESGEHYTVSDKNSKYEAEGWHESSEVSELPDVKVGMSIFEIDGEQIVYSGDSAGTEKITGDPRSSESDGIYDYEVSTVLEQGTVGIQTTSVSISSEQVNIEDEEMTYVHNDTIADELDDMIVGEEPIVIPETPTIAEGYGYEYLGSDQYSVYYPAWVKKERSSSFPDEEPVYTDDETGESYFVQYNHAELTRRHLTVPKLFLPDKTVDGEFFARWSSIEQFTITDVKRDRISAYCVDVNTPAREGFSYKINNLEDVHYYSDEVAAKIRAIAGYGYWGTLNEHFGSLETFKENLLNSGEFSQEEVDKITDGIALTAMQQAIWHFSNSMDGYVFVNNFHTQYEVLDRTHLPLEMDQDIAALIYKIFYHLLDLDPSYIPEEDKDVGNTVINERNSFDTVSFTLKDGEDGGYLGDFIFTFKFRPTSDNSDDLALQVLDENGDPLVTGRIIGEVQDGEVKVEEEEDGSFILEDIPLTDGEQSLSFIINGEQILAHNVYMLESEYRESETNKTSQTFICIASGKHHVNVKLDLTFDLEVNEETLRMEHFKRIEKDDTADDPKQRKRDPHIPLTGIN